MNLVIHTSNTNHLIKVLFTQNPITTMEYNGVLKYIQKEMDKHDRIIYQSFYKCLKDIQTEINTNTK